MKPSQIGTNTINNIQKKTGLKKNHLLYILIGIIIVIIFILIYLFFKLNG